MQTDKYSELLNRLENEELEVSAKSQTQCICPKCLPIYWVPFFAQNTALGAEFYQQLLAIYLYQIDLLVRQIEYKNWMN